MPFKKLRRWFDVAPEGNVVNSLLIGTIFNTRGVPAAEPIYDVTQNGTKDSVPTQQDQEYLKKRELLHPSLDSLRVSVSANTASKHTSAFDFKNPAEASFDLYFGTPTPQERERLQRLAVRDHSLYRAPGILFRISEQKVEGSTPNPSVAGPSRPKDIILKTSKQKIEVSTSIPSLPVPSCPKDISLKKPKKKVEFLIPTSSLAGPSRPKDDRLKTSKEKVEIRTLSPSLAGPSRPRDLLLKDSKQKAKVSASSPSLARPSRPKDILLKTSKQKAEVSTPSPSSAGPSRPQKGIEEGSLVVPAVSNSPTGPPSVPEPNSSFQTRLPNIVASSKSKASRKDPPSPLRPTPKLKSQRSPLSSKSQNYRTLDELDSHFLANSPKSLELSQQSSPIAKSAEMASSQINSQYLDPSAVGLAASKQKAIQEAKNQERAIHEKLKRMGCEMPELEFLELIGKGAYGRVFKAFDKEKKRIVALKVIDVDSTDYKVNARAKDDTIEVTVHEIKVLQQLKDSQAKNVNIIFDAFQIHSQLWIINDYCPGGSVHTLPLALALREPDIPLTDAEKMRATGNKLEERYIIPIARELAAGLHAIHEAGIIHRDVKSANVMIHENGSLQIIDFGVAGVLQSKIDKRTTVIGTPHWMPPELHKNAPPEGLNYGTEVDVWAYGCTLIECATGLPPNARVEPGRRLGATIGRTPPRLNDEKFSENFRRLIAFVLEGKASDRPSMEVVLQQPFITGTEETHPTIVLSELVKTYYRWERSGGVRQSLFYQGGAAAPEFPGTLGGEDEWNFSTTAGFEQQVATEDDLAITTVDPSNTTIPEQSFDSYLLPSAVYTPASTPRQVVIMDEKEGNKVQPGKQMTADEIANNEERVKRGEEALKGMFNQDEAPYKYDIKDDFAEQVTSKEKPTPPARSRSDLPLRSVNDETSFHHKEVELITDVHQSEDFELPNIDLANVGTIKANRLNRFQKDPEDEYRGEGSTSSAGQETRRATKDWKFPTFDLPTATKDANKKVDDENTKRATRDWKFPTFESNIVNTDASASTSNVEPSKRATMDWTFPSFLEASNTVQPIPPMPSLVVRPQLLHSATAPIGDLHQSEGILDLDELYDSEPSSTAPLSDDEYSRPPSDEEDVPPTSSDRSSNMTITGPAEATSNIPDDDFDVLNPFWFHESPSSNNVNIDAINTYLDSKGVTDALERASIRREFVRSHHGTVAGMKADLEEVGYNSSWGSENIAKGWDEAQAEVRSADASIFDDLVPPSAESMMEGASSEAVEGELKRLLEQWVGGMELLAGIFDEGEGNPMAEGEPLEAEE